MNASFTRGLQTVWDSTSLSWFKRCPELYRLKMLEGYQPRRVSAHLLFGQHYATAIERFHKKRIFLSHETALREVVFALLSETFEWVSDHPTKNRETLLRSVIWYIDEYRDDELKPIILKDGAPAVELTFKLELTKELVYGGHFDRIASMGEDIIVTDQKTTGSTISPLYFQGFSPDTQFTGYIFAAKALFGYPIKMAIIDAAQIAVGFTRFGRGIVTRTEPQLDEWLDDTLFFINLARQLTAEKRFPRNTAACSLYGGCEFRMICSASPAGRKSFLAADFVQNGWDPSKER